MMNVDKQNGNVKYADKEHVYWDDEGTYTSVTTLIGKYCQEFDKDFWSSYKALEKILSKEEFKFEKKNLLDTKKVNLQYYIDMYDITENEFNAAKQDILDGWQKENEKSCERGTQIHAELEHALLGKSEAGLEKYGFGGKFKVNTNASLENMHNTILDIDKGAFPEYLVYRKSNDGQLKIAGQIDLLIKDGNNISIIDYKGLPLDTEILTVNGWTTMELLQEGDKVFDKYGHPTTILHKSEIHYNPCYKINFLGGDSIVADYEHRWEIHLEENDELVSKVMTTSDIYQYLQEHTEERNLRIINPMPIYMEDKNLPVDPYILGIWLGTGSKFCYVSAPANYSAIWKYIESKGYRIGEVTDHRTQDENYDTKHIAGLQKDLNTLGILYNRNIPNMYYIASYQQRIKLLQGIMDTIGYYHIHKNRFSISVGKKRYSNNVIKLLGTLGIKATVEHVENSDKWDIYFYCNKFNPFLIRNNSIQFPLSDSLTCRYITSVKRVDTVPTQCIEVDSPTHTFLCTNKCIVTHNTNKKLDEKSYYNPTLKKYEMMKFPLNNLMDCNLMHYTMQLSTYAWMIQKLNPKFNIQMLKIIHYDHQGNVKEYELNYLKDEVERMLKDYKKSLILEKRKNARKQIEF